MIDANLIQNLLKELATKEGVFCSELDFQLKLAWLMKEKGFQLSLEYDPGCFEANASLDIMVWQPEHVAIELKYKTAFFETEVGGHLLRLKRHSAQDIGRYDFFRDVSRVEQIVANGKARRGFAIFLTNDAGYWRTGRGNTVDEMFRMCEKRNVTKGHLKWADRAGNGTTRGREDPVVLTHDYVLGWKDYANYPQKNGTFRYLIIDIEREILLS